MVYHILFIIRFTRLDPTYNHHFDFVCWMVECLAPSTLDQLHLSMSHRCHCCPLHRDSYVEKCFNSINMLENIMDFIRI